MQTVQDKPLQLVNVHWTKIEVYEKFYLLS